MGELVRELDVVTSDDLHVSISGQRLCQGFSHCETSILAWCCCCCRFFFLATIIALALDLEWLLALALTSGLVLSLGCTTGFTRSYE